MSRFHASGRSSVRLGGAFSRRHLLAGIGVTALASQARPWRGIAGTRQAADALVKGVYLNPLAGDIDSELALLVDLIDRTELNALVIDVKEDGVYVDTGVPLFQEAGTVLAFYDVDAVLETLRANNIYSIARLVAFKDTLLATARPDLAVLDSGTELPWQDMNGVSWVNPLLDEVQAANVAFAVELAERGFDEIQFDYVRFPTDGDLEAMDFGEPVDAALQIATITAFLASATDELAPLETACSADVFGYTLLQADIGIGQNVASLSDAVDYISPMLYPSHFPEGSIDVPGHPNDFPAETIETSFAAGVEMLGDDLSLLRPWLQDFSLPGMTEYGPDDVRAQIDAAEAAGASGWMIWNAANVYQEAAFTPAE